MEGEVFVGDCGDLVGVEGVEEGEGGRLGKRRREGDVGEVLL